MFVLLCPALGLVDGAAHGLTLHFAVLHQGLPAHLNNEHGFKNILLAMNTNCGLCTLDCARHFGARAQPGLRSPWPGASCTPEHGFKNMLLAMNTNCAASEHKNVQNNSIRGLTKYTSHSYTSMVLLDSEHDDYKQLDLIQSHEKWTCTLAYNEN